MAIALMHYGLEDNAEPLIETLSRDRDPILRYGAMFTIGLAYAGTNNNSAIRRLLHVAVSDVSDDVRRAAVINLGFVLFRTTEQVRYTQTQAQTWDQDGVLVLYQAWHPILPLSSNPSFPSPLSLQVPRLVSLLSESFNPHVRYGSCIAVGIACAGSGSAEAVALLEPMLEDVADYVRQAAMIALAMVYMQQSEVSITTQH
jgi:26S proteasome regulatory subunit N2